MHAGYQERFFFDDIGRKRVVERQRGRERGRVREMERDGVGGRGEGHIESTF